MSKIKVELSLGTTKFEIDLEDEYGIDVSWNDLTEDEQNKIKDRIREEYIVYVNIEEIEND